MNYEKLILDNIDFSGYAPSDTIRSIYHAEYGSWNGCTIVDCMNYLQGLPSVCTIPFMNHEIYELLGIDPDSDPDGKAIEKYWYNAGKAFKKVIHKNFE